MSNFFNRTISPQFSYLFGAQTDGLSQRRTESSGIDSSGQADADSQISVSSASSEPKQTAFCADEKFELMSAYLDGEVSEQERTLVEDWLANDPQLLSIYQQQVKLRKAVKKLGRGLFE